MDTAHERPARSTSHLSLVGDGPHRPDAEFARAQTDVFAHLIRLVGSEETLWRVDAEPLPDEPFDWTSVQARDALFVGDVLALTDRCCELALDDVEFRTIVRRILARVAALDPRPLRRSPHPGRCAAALVWLAGALNGGFVRRGKRNDSWIWQWFGVSSCSDRGTVLHRAAAFVPDSRWSGGSTLVAADPAYLHSRFRAAIATERDRLVEVAAERRTWAVDHCEGLTSHVRVASTDVVPLAAVKVMPVDEGRAAIVVGFGDHADDDIEQATYLSLTIPDAHELVRMLDDALDGPMPGLEPSPA